MELSGEKALERSTNVKSSLTQLPNYYSHKRRNQREVQRETRIERCRTKLAFGQARGDSAGLMEISCHLKCTNFHLDFPTFRIRKPFNPVRGLSNAATQAP